MKKFTLVLTIAILCSFAAVRRREEQDGEELFQEAITRIMEEDFLVYNVSDSEAHIGNNDHLFMDYPLMATQVLDSAFNRILLVDNKEGMDWIRVSSLQNQSPLPDFRFLKFLN